jgi:hypothetical protein
MAYTEILTSHGLSQTQWDNDIFKEYIGQMWWKNWMGTDPSSIVVVKEDLTKKAGDTIRVGLRGLMEGGKVTGNSKAIGNEGRVQYYYDSVTVDNIRYVVKVEDIPMSQQRVGFDLLTDVKSALQEKAQDGTDDDILDALIGDNSTGRVRGRYLYGAADSNWNATHATALTAIDNTSDQLASNMIDVAKRKAKIPTNATAKIRPMKIKNGKNYEEWFLFVAHDYCIRDLVNNDAAFRNENLLLPPRQGEGGFMFTGSNFKGNWRGVLVYENEKIPLISSTIQVAHNLFLGAGAAAIAWGQRSKFGEEYTDIGHDGTWEIHEIRGIEKMVFNRSTEEDNAVVHVFAAAVAD